MESDFWGGLRDAFRNLFSNEGFQSFGKEVGPALGGALGAGFANMAFPGQGERVIGADVRTGTGQAAEGLRFQGAQGASKALMNARAGVLDPRLEQKVRSRQRNADAARGSLETGGSGRRETDAIQDELDRVIQRESGNLNSMTSGYQSLSPQRMSATRNPWADLLSNAVGPSIQKGLKNSWGKWGLWGNGDEVDGV